MEVTPCYDLLSLLSLFTKFTLPKFYPALQTMLNSFATKKNKYTNTYYGFIALYASKQKVEVDWVILL